MTLRKKISIKGAPGEVQLVNAAMEGLTSLMKDADRRNGEMAERAARIIISESNKLVPRDTNALAESWQAGAEKLKSKPGFRAVASYGGRTRAGATRNAPTGIVDYAVIVHEDLEQHHDNGEAKFLEKGAEAAKERIEDMFKTGFGEIFAGRMR